MRNHPVMYWPLIVVIAVVLTKGGLDEVSAWAFWLGLTISIGLALEWWKTKARSFAVLAVIVIGVVSFLFRESIRQTGSLHVLQQTTVLESPYPEGYAGNANRVLKVLNAGETVKFKDTYFGKDFVMYKIGVDGATGYISNDSSIEIIYDSK